MVTGGLRAVVIQLRLIALLALFALAAPLALAAQHALPVPAVLPVLLAALPALLAVPLALSALLVLAPSLAPPAPEPPTRDAEPAPADRTTTLVTQFTACVRGSRAPPAAFA